MEARMITANLGAQLYRCVNLPESKPHDMPSKDALIHITRAHAGPNTELLSFIKENGWLVPGTVLVCHDLAVDTYWVSLNDGEWSILHEMNYRKGSVGHRK